MNVLIFLIILAIFLAVLYYVSMFRGRRKAAANRFFWISGGASVVYAIFFNGILDKIFIIIFAFFIVFAKMFMYMIES